MLNDDLRVQKGAMSVCFFKSTIENQQSKIMKTLERFAARGPDIPMVTAWSLTELAEMKGHQGLFTKQSPEKLNVLREHAIIESAVSSNRIEGVMIDPDRAKAVILGKGRLRDRNEEEVRNYRKALNWIHAGAAGIPASVPTVRRLHETCRGEMWDAGKFKEEDGDIIETFSDGTSRVRFRTVAAADTAAAMDRWTALSELMVKDQQIPSLILMAATNLDFLCIHPFRDGNGRVSRLILLLQLYHLGYEVGRYISIERTIEQNKDRYYETLQQSSAGWHRGEHDPWPYINYLLFIVKEAYKEFEQRVGEVRAERGSKTALVKGAVTRSDGLFTLSDIESQCPGVSRDMIRRVLWDLQKAGGVECVRRGPGATWRKRM